LIGQFLAAGEFPIALFLHSQIPISLKDKGAPVGFVYLPPYVTKLATISIAKNAPHPYSAILLYDYLLVEGFTENDGREIGPRINPQRRRGEISRITKIEIRRRESGDRRRSDPAVPEVIPGNIRNTLSRTMMRFVGSLV
jgi:hypothetical protein